MSQRLLVFEPQHIEPALALYRACPGVGLSAGDTAPELAQFLARNPGFSAVVVAARGDLLGAILCGHDGRRGSLYHLAVRPDVRHRGLGRALVLHSLTALRHAGIPRVSIHVFANNAEGAAFWSKLGFQGRGDLSVQQFELVRTDAA